MAGLILKTMKSIRIFFALCLMLVLGTDSAQAQYYYQHMVNAALGNERFAALKEAGVRRIVAKSYSPENEQDTSFLLEQMVDANRNQLILQSRSDFSSPGYMVSQYDSKGRIAGIYDSSGSIVNKSTYLYNAAGLLTELSSTSSDTVQNFSITEKFLITFNENRNPVEMLRVKNGLDTTWVRLIPSENGKPGEEQWWKNGRRIATYYYYYNPEGYITDVAQFNNVARRVLPLYTFEYNEYGEMTGKVIVPIGSDDYRIWRMEYNDDGLLTSERAFSKNNQLEGRIEYSYQ